MPRPSPSLNHSSSHLRSARPAWYIRRPQHRMPVPSSHKRSSFSSSGRNRAVAHQGECSECAAADRSVVIKKRVKPTNAKPNHESIYVHGLPSLTTPRSVKEVNRAGCLLERYTSEALLKQTNRSLTRPRRSHMLPGYCLWLRRETDVGKQRESTGLGNASSTSATLFYLGNVSARLHRVYFYWRHHSMHSANVTVL